MKKTIILIVIICLSFANAALATPEIGDGQNGSQNSVIVAQASAVNIEKIIDNKENVQDFIQQKAVEGVDIFPKPSLKDNRICPFCWLFAAIYAGFLYKYGEQLKKRKKLPKNWYEKPLYYALWIYLAHALIHVFLASNIFLYYYWMILFDEFIVAFLYYHFIFFKKISKRTFRKTI